MSKIKAPTSVDVVIKRGASFRWSSSLYCPMRNSKQMTIGKTLVAPFSEFNFNLYSEINFWEPHDFSFLIIFLSFGQNFQILEMFLVPKVSSNSSSVRDVFVDIFSVFVAIGTSRAARPSGTGLDSDRWNCLF